MTMPISRKNPQVDAWLKAATRWRKELAKLRAILLASDVTEEWKWGKPCYTFQGTNLNMIYGLKESCAIAFFTGALLKDACGILGKPGPNTQAGRWVKFTTLAEIVKLEPVLKAYIAEAIAAEKKGLKVVYKTTPEPVPEELQRKLAKNAALKKAFAALTPGRQRGYILFFAGAKQAATRDARIEKCTPRILAGRGLQDR